jgi:hypothetical protein
MYTHTHTQCQNQTVLIYTGIIPKYLHNGFKLLRLPKNTVTRNAYSIVSCVSKYMPLKYSPPLFYKKPNTYISNATTWSAFYVAHVVGHYTDRFAILQAARRSPLLKFTVQRGPSMYGNSVKVVLTLKDGAGNGFFRHADTCYMPQARCLLNIKVFSHEFGSCYRSVYNYVILLL